MTQPDKKAEVTDNLADEVTQMAKLLDETGLGTGTKRLLAVMLLPESVDMQKTEICKLAGVSRELYYKSITDDKFVAAQNKWLRKLYGGVAPRLMHRLIDQAMNKIDQWGNRGDWKAIDRVLEILKFIEPKGESININVTIEQVEQKRIENQRIGLSRFGLITVDKEIDADSN